jgi:hypothetical protein
MDWVPKWRSDCRPNLSSLHQETLAHGLGTEVAVKGGLFFHGSESYLFLIFIDGQSLSIH